MCNQSNPWSYEKKQTETTIKSRRFASPATELDWSHSFRKMDFAGGRNLESLPEIELIQWWIIQATKGIDNPLTQEGLEK